MTRLPSWARDATYLDDDVAPLPTNRPFTRAEAAALGVGWRRLARLVETGRLRCPTYGVFAARTCADDLASRLAALRLVVPAGAVVTDRTAAWLHGVDLLERSALWRVPRASFHLPPGRRMRRAPVVSGERMLRTEDVVEIGGLVVTSPLRTALDLGRLLWRYDALAALDGFVQRGVDLDQARQDVERFKGYRGVVQLRHLLRITDPRSGSAGESALRLHWYEAGLPRPELQIWVADDDGVGRYCLDMGLEEERFGAEYDGRAHHTLPEDVEHDGRRRSWLHGARGWHIEVFRSEDVYRYGADPGPRLVAARRRRRAA